MMTCSGKRLAIPCKEVSGKSIGIALFLVLLLSACSEGTSSGGDKLNTREITSADSGSIIEQPPAPEPRPPKHYTREENYPAVYKAPLQVITLPSGYKLGVYVTLPALDPETPAEGPFPTILIQTGYNINVIGALGIPGSSLLSAAEPEFVKRGYAYVNVDVIGTGISTGVWEMIGETEQNGYGETVDWVVQQPWSNGEVGLSGASYMAITALLTAAQRPAPVKAVFASVPLGDAMRGTVGIGGMINGFFMSYWLKLTHQTAVTNGHTSLLYPSLRKHIDAATRQHISQIENFYLPTIERAIAGDPEIAYDGPFWRTRSPIERIDEIQAPTFFLGALHDIFQRDVPLLYEALAARGVDTRLVIYNGDHVRQFLPSISGNEALDSTVWLMLQWFDEYLMGLDTGLETIPPVTQYVKNRSRSVAASLASTTAWPHPQLSPERWYLRGDMRLTRKAPATAEETNSMYAAPFAEYSYGSSNGGTLLEFSIQVQDGSNCSISKPQWSLGIAGILDNKGCYYDHAELESNALNYQTDTMDQDYYLNGPIQADIWIDSSVTDAVVSVRVDDVNPATGVVKPITNGSLLASARAVDESRSRFIDGVMIQPYHYLSLDHEQLLAPGEIVKLSVEIFPTSVIIPRGHKIRVSIAPSNQTQGILNDVQRARVNGGVTTIYNSPDYPSSIVLPAVPLTALN